MGHIHTGPGEYDDTASAYIVRTDISYKPKLILGKHKKIPDLWMQFGGHKEKDENIWDAAKREILDESGYEIGQLKILQPKDRLKTVTNALLHPVNLPAISHAFQGDKNHMHTDFAFAFVTDHPPARRVAEGEVGEFGYFSYSELSTLSEQEKIYENVRQVGQYVLETCLTDWEPVDTREFN